MSKITRLKQQLKRAGITQDQVAAQAGVTRFMVNHVLNGRAVSRHVIRAAQDLMVARAILGTPKSA